jgi:alpha-L-rhamnosidase
MAGGGMNSHNHIMFGSVDAWFYRVLAGISLDSASSGFRKVVIKPYIPDDLKYAGGSVDTVRGLLSSSWRKEADELVLDVTLPVNSEGTIFLPLRGLPNPFVKENGIIIFQNDSFIPGVSGIRAGKREDGFLSFSVGSGSYSFGIGNASH